MVGKKVTSFPGHDIDTFLPERDYVMFGYLLSQIRLSSVTIVHHPQPVEIFGNVSAPLSSLAIR